jgi:hypothetical protein
VPFSVEAPDLALLESLGPAEFARRARRAVARLLATNAEPAASAGTGT